MPQDLTLSKNLQRLLNSFEEHGDLSDDDVVEIEGSGLKSLITALQIMRKMAISMEIELTCHRDNEAGREMRKTMEGQATDQLDDLIAETSGKIIRPNFGRKPS